MAKYWYKNAIIYSMDVETFMDSNGDGIGDFRGLSRSLDYLAGLGITCIWLLPFFPSPNKDNGYDVTDYFGVDPKFGTFGHFVEFLDMAEERGMRVLIDLVINHTSIKHRWFQEARKSKDSKYRNYYIWVDEKPKDADKYVVFPEHQNGNWAYDEMAGQYYYHTFYDHQADLNISNPEVQKEIKYILHFWLKLGVSGFRMDAVPFMLMNKGNEKFKGDPHDFIRDIRDFVENQKKEAVLLAEINTTPDKYKNYFGEGDQVHMLFDFYLNAYLFLSFAQKKAGPLAAALKKMPQTSLKNQLATFIRNHDELDLGRLSDKEREEVYKVFAPDENMRLYDRGIRRRFPPMVENDRKRLELAYSLLFSLPGTPVLRYGEEIGMGDDLSLKERESVRTAMQWTDQKNCGFTVATGKIPVSVISSGEYGCKNVNVHKQMRNPNSFLNWVERAIATRKECVEFGLGDHSILKVNNSSVMVHCCRYEKGCSIAVHNFGEEECVVKIDLEDDDAKHLVECFGDQEYEPFDPEKKELKVGGYGYRWFRKSSLFL